MSSKKTQSIKFAAKLRPAVNRKPNRWLQQKVVKAEALSINGLGDPRYRALIERIDTSPWWSVEQLTPLFEGADFYQKLIESIEQAQQEILIESYIFHADQSGQGIAQALAQAATRGLRVCVLVDAWGSNETHPSFWDELRQQGIECQRFKPARFGFLYPIIRDHRKLYIIDRNVAYLGGMNVGDEYLLQTEDSWRDTQVEIRGGACAELTVVFNECWTQAGGRPLTLPKPSDHEYDAKQHQVLVQDSRPGRGLLEATLGFIATCYACQQRLWITNAYFAPKRMVIKSLLATVARGVDVRLLFPAKSDIPILKWAARSIYADLLKGGVKIYEYQPRVLHAKSLLGDQNLSVIGSQNLDARSYQFNAECNLMIDSEGVNQTLSEQFLGDIKNAVEITESDWRQRSISTRLKAFMARLIAPLL